MNADFRTLVEGLEPKLRELTAMPPVRLAEHQDTPLPNVPASGTYLFTETGRHFYVGRSRSLSKRVRVHGRPSSRENQAPFAFLLARHATGHGRATYREEGSRKELMQRPEFREAFQAARARIRAMDLRYVEETDPLRQCLLEVYAAVALKTRYNDFDTH